MEQEYNFEPNYAEWWHREDLEKEDYLWLMLGISPDDVKRDKDLGKKTNRTNEETQWKNKFFNYYHNIDAFIGTTIKQHKDLLEWNGSKEELVQDAYEFFMPIDDKLLNYLMEIGDFKKCPELEDYKNHNQYKLGEEQLSIDEIKTEEKAFAVLLGLNPEFFLRFVQLDTKQEEAPKDKRGYSAFIHLPPEDKWFYSLYRKFLRKEYAHMYQPVNTFIAAFDKAKSLNLWDGNFSKYANQLYNEGFVFFDEVVLGLATQDIRLNYEGDSKAIKFYKRWEQKKMWSLEEALYLLTGVDPNSSVKESFFTNLCHIRLYILHERKKYYDFESDRHESIEDLLRRHVLSGDITEYKKETINNGEKANEPVYDCVEITKWLMDITGYTPPPAMLEVLGIDKPEQQEVAVSESTSKSCLISEFSFSSGAPNTAHKTNELKQAVENLINEKGAFPSCDDVMKHFSETFEDKKTPNPYHEINKVNKVSGLYYGDGKLWKRSAVIKILNKLKEEYENYLNTRQNKTHKQKELEQAEL